MAYLMKLKLIYINFMIIDLQIHSTYSDGYLSPTVAADFLAKQGVKVASLTDHNTLAGYFEFNQACRQHGIKVVPGIEIYTRFDDQQINILWYNLPLDNPSINQLMLESQKHWLGRLRRHLDKLIKAKLLIAGSEIAIEKFTHYVPTNGLLDAILTVPGNREIISKQLGNSIFREEEAIGLLFSNNKIGRLRPSCISLERVVRLNRQFGGQLVFCHPAKGRSVSAKLVARLKAVGVHGLEVLSPHHSLGAVFYLQDLAERNDMIITGGSDFHRFEEGRHGLTSVYDYWQVDSDNLRRIKEIIG